jgi:hypothetical protein
MRPNAPFLRPFIAVCALSSAMLASAAALAAGVGPGEASPAQKAEAMAHFTTGKQAIEQQNWEKATLELRASLDVVNSPNARLVLARALRDSGKTADAWIEFSHTIGDANRLAVAEDRYKKTAEAATTERAELEPKLAFVTVTLAHAPPDATLKAAGRVVSPEEWAGPIVVPAGAVDVVLADAEGKELARQTVGATVGQKTAVTLDARPAPPPPAKVAEQPAEEEKQEKPAPVDTGGGESDRSRLRPYAYVAGGIGVAGLALFTVFGVMDNSTFNDLQSGCPRNVCPPGKQSEIDSGRTQQAVANVSLVVGAVGVAAGAALFVVSLSPKSSSGTGTGLVFAPGYVGLRGAL